MAADKHKCAAYQGTEPYIFISYAHKDSDAVLAVVEELTARRYRLWYDEGIEVGADWPEVIAGRLAGASHVIVFTSEASVRSQNCTREINYAIDRKKTISRVQLDESTPEGGMGMQLSVVPTVDAGGCRAAEFCDALEKLGCLTDQLKGDGLVNNGEFIIEDDGTVMVSNGNLLLQDGSLNNHGLLMVRDLGKLYFNGGSFENARDAKVEIQRRPDCLNGDGEFVGDLSKITGYGRFFLYNERVTTGR